MDKKEEGHIIHYYFTRLNKYARQMEKDLDARVIHLFRVEAKKLRAFLRMLAFEEKGSAYLKLPRRLKAMYSLAGKVRDHQLQLKQIINNDKNNEITFHKILSVIEQQIENLKKRRHEFLSKKELLKIEEKLKKQLPDKTASDIVEKFSRQKLEWIREIVAKGTFKDEELHTIRKSIKDIVHIIKIFRDDMKISVPFLLWNRTDLKKAEDLAHTLGLFNDTCTALSFIKSQDIKEPGLQEEKHRLLMRRQLLGEKQRLKKDILNKISGLNLDHS